MGAVMGCTFTKREIQVRVNAERGGDPQRGLGLGVWAACPICSVQVPEPSSGTFPDLRRATPVLVCRRPLLARVPNDVRALPRKG